MDFFFPTGKFLVAMRGYLTKSVLRTWYLKHSTSPKVRISYWGSVEKAWPNLLLYNFSPLGPLLSAVWLAESGVPLLTSTHIFILAHHSTQIIWYIWNKARAAFLFFSLTWRSSSSLYCLHCGISEGHAVNTSAQSVGYS